MEHFIDFIKRTWILLFVLFMAPIIVIVFFMVQDLVCEESVLKVNDWVTLLAASFSYWGTIILGTLAFWQNDRILKLEERDREIRDIKLKIENTPDFCIENIIYQDNEYNTCTIEKEKLHRRGFKEVYQGDINRISNDLIVLEIELKNHTNINAYDVEYFDCAPGNTAGDRNRDFYRSNYNKRSVVLGGRALVLDYYIFLDEIDCINDVKLKEYEFNLKYRNVYNHYFYNYVRIAVGNLDDDYFVKVSLGEQHEGKKDLNEREINYIVES